MSSIQSISGNSGINKTQKVNATNGVNQISKTADESLSTKATVKISDQAQILAQEDVNIDKINNLREQIQNGAYKPNAENIAKKIINEALVIFKK